MQIFEYILLNITPYISLLLMFPAAFFCIVDFKNDEYEGVSTRGTFFGGLCLIMALLPMMVIDSEILEAIRQSNDPRNELVGRLFFIITIIATTWAYQKIDWKTLKEK